MSVCFAPAHARHILVSQTSKKIRSNGMQTATPQNHPDPIPLMQPHHQRALQGAQRQPQQELCSNKPSEEAVCCPCQFASRLPTSVTVTHVELQKTIPSSIQCNQHTAPHAILISSHSCSLTISVRFKERSDNDKKSLTAACQVKRQPVIVVLLRHACQHPSQSQRHTK